MPGHATLPLDHLPLHGDAQRVALITADGRTYDYAALERATGRLAAWLSDQLPSRGDRVASWLSKGALAAILPLAAARAGLVHVPINPLLKRPQVHHILADAEANLLIAQHGRAALLEPGDVPDRCRLATAEAAATAMDDESLTAQEASLASPDDLCAILYTSGSTGRPKGVMLSHANLTLGAQAVAQYLELAPDDRTLCVLPFSFDYGQNQLFSTWFAGGAVIPFDYLLPRDVTRAVARHGITTLAGVPPLWVQLAEIAWAEGAADTLRRLTNSGGALTRPLVSQMRAMAPQADIYAMYGLTEAFRSTYLPPDLIDSHPTSMGRAIPFAEILVVAPDGSIAADDVPGELVHCGPLVAHGYWRDAHRTAERFRPAPPQSAYGGIAVWSGDTVRRASDGLLYFVGRDDAMIKSAGNRISPTEIEEVAVTCPGIAEAVAVGVPDERLGQAVMLIVRAADASVIEELEAILRRDLPNYMQPRRVLRWDALPRSPNGKIDRVALLAEVIQ